MCTTLAALATPDDILTRSSIQYRLEDLQDPKETSEFKEYLNHMKLPFFLNLATPSCKDELQDVKPESPLVSRLYNAVQNSEDEKKSSSSLSEHNSSKSSVSQSTSDNDATSLFNKGVALYIFNRKEEGLECFHQAISIDGTFRDGWFLKGVTLCGLGRKEEGLECFHQAISIDGTFRDGWFLKGVTLCGLGREEEGVKCLDRAMEIEGDDKVALFNKGVALCKLDRKEEGMECFDRAISIDGNFKDAWFLKGVTLCELGRKEEGLECFDRAISIDGKFRDAWSVKGVTLCELGREEEGIKCLDQAISVDENFRGAWFNKGVALRALGRKEEGLECFDRAISIDGNFKDAWFLKGVTLFEVGRKEEAMKHFHQAISIDVTFRDGWFLKGVALRALGRNEEAMKCFHQAISIDGTFRDGWFLKGVTLFELDRKEDGLECLDRAISIDENFRDAWDLKGVTLCELDRKEEGLECLDRAISIDQNFKDAWFNKGVTLRALGRKEEGLECFDQAISIDENFKDAWDLKRVTLSELGREEDPADPSPSMEIHSGPFDPDARFSVIDRMLQRAVPESRSSIKVSQIGASSMDSSTVPSRDFPDSRQPLSLNLQPNAETTYHLSSSVPLHCKKWVELDALFQSPEILRAYVSIVLVPDVRFGVVCEASDSQTSSENTPSCCTLSSPVLSNVSFVILPFRNLHLVSKVTMFFSDEKTASRLNISVHVLVLDESSLSETEDTYWLEPDPGTEECSLNMIPPLLHARMLPGCLFGRVVEVPWNPSCLRTQATQFLEPPRLEYGTCTGILVPNGKFDALLSPILYLVILSNPILLNDLMQSTFGDSAPLVGVTPLDQSGFSIELFFASGDDRGQFHAAALYSFLIDARCWLSIEEMIVPLMNVEKELHLQYPGMITWIGRSVDPTTGTVSDRTHFHLACSCHDQGTSSYVEHLVRSKGYDFVPKSEFDIDADDVDCNRDCRTRKCCTGLPRELVPLARKISSYCWSAFGFSKCEDRFVVDQLYSSSLPIVCVHPRRIHSSDMDMEITCLDGIFEVDMNSSSSSQNVPPLLQYISNQPRSQLELSVEEKDSIVAPWIVFGSRTDGSGSLVQGHVRTGLVTRSNTNRCFVTVGHGVKDYNDISIYPNTNCSFENPEIAKVKICCWEEDMDFALLDCDSLHEKSRFPDISFPPFCDPIDALDASAKFGVKFLRIAHSTLQDSSPYTEICGCLQSDGLYCYNSIVRKDDLRISTDSLCSVQPRMNHRPQNAWMMNAWKLHFVQKGVFSQRGDCGTPYFLFHKDGRKVAGMHFAGNGFGIRGCVLVVPIWNIQNKIETFANNQSSSCPIAEPSSCVLPTPGLGSTSGETDLIDSLTNMRVSPLPSD